jgi:spermidine/putrescine transport system substrate-binding protein
MSREAVAAEAVAAREIIFANWPGYIDTDPAGPVRHPSLAEFTRRFGVAVRYREPIGSNEQFFTQIGVPLAMGRPCGYDLIVLTDWLADQLLGLGWVSEIPAGAVPNSANLLPALLASPLASVFRHALPWQAGFTGIGYNAAATGRAVTSITDLLTAPDLHGRVTLAADMRDVVGLVLLEQGHDPAAFTDAQFDLAVEVLDRACRSGQIRAVTNQYQAGLDRGDIAACVAWAGDVLVAQRHNPAVRFVLPEAGGMLWADTMLVPAHAEHPREAWQLMGYYYEPEVAARVAADRLFLCPVAGAEEALRVTGRRLPGAEYVFPPPALLSRGHYFARLTPVRSAVYTERFTSAVGL